MQKWLHGYYALISLLDRQFGRLIEALKESGEYENTIIVYTSDHGDMLGAHGLLKKQFPHNESIKVPLMLHWQGHTIPSNSDEIIGLVDLPVSLLGLMGIKFSSLKDGKDLHSLFVDYNAKGLEVALTYDLVPCHQSYMRNGHEWMGIYSKNYTYAMDSNYQDYILFDNINDRIQQKNIANENKEISKKYKNILLNIINENGYKFRNYERMIKEDNYLEDWNKSQACFNLPVL